MPRIVRSSAVLPQPDSPITARTRPRWRENDTSFTARSGPSRVLNSVVSPRTSSSGCWVLGSVLAWTSTDVVIRWPPPPSAPASTHWGMDEWSLPNGGHHLKHTRHVYAQAAAGVPELY